MALTQRFARGLSSLGKCAVGALATLSLLLAASPASAGVYGSGYAERGRCGPFPRAQVATPPYMCAGIVAGPAHGFDMPRSILELDRGRLLITDMGSWGPLKGPGAGQGRLLLLTVAPDGKAKVETLFRGLVVPHGLARGPDGRIYVGEAQRIWRFDPAAPQTTRETVQDKLPWRYSHRLTQLVFDREGRLVVNMGAPNDQCAPSPASYRGGPQQPCKVAEGPSPLAALWTLRFEWPQGAPGAFTPLARGLRNSMALAVHPESGLIVQGENNIDHWGSGRPGEPPEELNVITPGAHYGWPYCAGDNVRNPALPAGKVQCSGSTAPAVLMPAHTAPLAMAYYTGSIFPELSGKLIVALHGYREPGFRIVAYDTEPDGTPKTPPRKAGGPGLPLTLVGGWDYKPGVRPRGAPSGLTVAADGSIWIVEDGRGTPGKAFNNNRTVLVLLRTGEAPETEGPMEMKLALPAPPAQWATLYKRVLKPRCGGCHQELLGLADAGESWSRLVEKGLLDPEAAATSDLIERMLAADGARVMPPGAGLGGDTKARRLIEDLLRALQR